MELRPGQKLYSAVCDAQFVVVRAPSTPVDVGCGGAPLRDDEQPPSGVPAPVRRARDRGHGTRVASMDVPADLRYSTDHEWISIDGNRVRVGITDYAQGELGDVVFVELPGVGAPVVAHSVCGTIEAVKAVAELFAPVSGEGQDTVRFGLLIPTIGSVGQIITITVQAVDLRGNRGTVSIRRLTVR